MYDDQGDGQQSSSLKSYYKNMEFVAFMQVKDQNIKFFFHQIKERGLELASTT